MALRASPRLSALLSSRWTKLGLAATATLLIGITVYAAVLIMRRQEVMRDISRYNVTWQTSQAAYEFARLQMAAGAHAAGVPGVDQDEVQLRLDIVLNRVQLFEHGELAAFLRSSTKLQDIVTRFKHVTGAAQPLVDKLDADGSARRLLALLAPLNASLTRLSATAHDHSDALMVRDLGTLSQLYWVLSGVLILLIGSSLGLVTVLVWHNRLLMLAHDNVKKLVNDLQESGHALTGAMQEAQAHNTVLQERDRAMHTQNERFDAALNNMSQALVMVDAEQRLIVCNVRYAELFGLDQMTMLPGTHVTEIAAAVQVAGRYGPGLIDAVWKHQRGLVAKQQSDFFFKEDEKGRALSVAHQPMTDGGWVATYEDITERRGAEAQIRHMAHHDALTNLPNRRMFYSRLEEGLGKLRRHGPGLAVHCIDLDFFKHVNDTLGHPAGDALLEAVGRRLRNCVRQTDIVARLGGDEFAILQYAETAEQAQDLAVRVLEAVRAPYDLEGRRAVVGASIGIALATDGTLDAERLFCNADLALYRSKADGRGTFCFFEPGIEAEQETRYSIELNLRDALQRQEFELYYQPIFDLGRDRISGYEALLRWHHPERGMVPPAQFIPVAEKMGLINGIGEWVLQRACMDAARWLLPVKVAVNLSPMQFRNDDLVRAVTFALEAADLPAERLELEITESVLLQNDDRVLTILHQLRALGVKTVLDDFGTGYSSLSYLRSFPFDKIKVDQSFVRDMDTRPDCMAIVESIANLARKLGMTTTAEGVETDEQLQQLRSSGFTEIQGYLLGRPEPNDAIRVLTPALAKNLPQPSGAAEKTVGSAALVH